MLNRFFRAAWTPRLLSALTLAIVLVGCDGRQPRNLFTPSVAQTVTDETRDSLAVGDELLTQTLPQGMPEVVLRRKAYVCSYNPNTLQPNYVAWRLTAEHTDGPIDRKITNFHTDEEVPGPQVTTRDYSRSGYDRGHMCPAADNKWDETAMRECFLMSNICPQNPRLNQGDWQEIEQACRKWAAELGEIWIVCGPVFMNRTHRMIGSDVQIPVPEAFFKVVLCTKGKTPRAIGFVCRNEAGNREKGAYVNSLAEVERVTGIGFFPALDPEMRSAVEKDANLAHWP